MSTKFEYASPESCGVSSRDVLGMIGAFEDAGLDMHSYILLRHGKIISEGYWKPFSSDRPHRIYSSGKTVAALFVGLLYGEGKLSLDDKAISYFPDKLKVKPHPYIAAMTIRDMLKMATPFDRDVYKYGIEERISAFLSDTPKYPAGDRFSYNTSASYTLTAIGERITGKRMLEYMRPRLLDKIGVSDSIRCLRMPDGYSHSGSGIICTQRDFAAFTELVRRRGLWDGEHLIPRDYMEEMTSAQIDNPPVASNDYKGYGYGYQLWMMRGKDRFTLLGMGDQLGICFADKGISFSCMADNQGSAVSRDIIFSSVKKFVVDRASDSPLPPAPEESARLAEKNVSLVFAPPVGSLHSPLENSLNGVQFILRENPMGITKLQLTFGETSGELEYVNEQGKKKLCFGLGWYANGYFPQRGYPDGDYHPSDGLYECIAAGAWTTDDAFSLKVATVGDFLGHVIMSFSFADGGVHVDMKRAAQFFLDEYNGATDGRAAAR